MPKLRRDFSRISEEGATGGQGGEDDPIMDRVLPPDEIEEKEMKLRECRRGGFRLPASRAVRSGR
jgi:hypothetical protein